jgi:hypothetical protein
MKLIAATVVLLGLLSCWTQCSFRSTNNSSALSENNGVGQKRPSEVVMNGDKELQTQYLAMGKELRRAARNLGLENLSDSAETRDEIRIWVGFGIILPTCLVLTRIRNVNDATFIAPKVRADKVEMDSKGNVIYAKTMLGPPKSGWEKLDGFLDEQGIDSPIRLSPKRHYTIDPDETFVVIEARSGTAYDMVFFPTVDEGTEAKKALGACRRLESEFGINMGCGAQK